MAGNVQRRDGAVAGRGGGEMEQRRGGEASNEIGGPAASCCERCFTRQPGAAGTNDGELSESGMVAHPAVVVPGSSATCSHPFLHASGSPDTLRSASSSCRGIWHAAIPAIDRCAAVARTIAALLAAQSLQIDFPLHRAAGSCSHPAARTSAPAVDPPPHAWSLSIGVNNPPYAAADMVRAQEAFS